MPCRGPEPEELEYEAQQELAKVVPLLCEACSLLEDSGTLNSASKELKLWYKKHEECEADRVRLEAAEKLSERERRLLGIDIDSLARKANK